MQIFKLFRPTTLVAPAVGALLFQFLAIHQHGIPVTGYVLFKVAVGMFILAMTNAAGNIINHVVDSYDTDLYHKIKRDRPLASGMVDRMVATSMAVYIFGLSLVLAFVIFGTVPGLLVSLIMFFAWAYSAPPRFKRMLVLGNLSIGTPRGFLGVVTAYSFFADPTQTILAFGLVMGVFVFGVNTTKDIGDMEADRQAGIRNFVTTLGPERAIRWVIVPALYLPFVLWYVFIIISGHAVTWQYYTLFLAIPLSVGVHRTSLSTMGENTAGWYLFYAEMSAMIVLFALPFLI